MQTLVRGGHRAVWGGYEIVIRHIVRTNTWSLRIAKDNVLVSMTSSLPSSDEAIRSAATMLKNLKCHAVVNGKLHSVEDFLYFVEEKNV